MTVVMCLDYGYKIYVATDSLITFRGSDGLLRKVGYRLKLYTVPNCNAIVAFSGHLITARNVLKHIGKYAQKHQPTEKTLFNQLYSLISEAIKELSEDQRGEISILFAGLTPGSKDYERKFLPEFGVPNKTFCIIWSWRKDTNKLSATLGNEQLNHSAQKGFVPKSPGYPMDILVAGSGSNLIAPNELYQNFFDWINTPHHFVLSTMGTYLSGFFSALPIENSGIGGDYQVALISEDGVDVQLSPNENHIFNSISVEYKNGVYVIQDNAGSNDYIQTLFDTRIHHEITEEIGYLI